MPELPTGTVTFLFGDVEGSTELLERLGVDYATELAGHRAIVRESVAANGGEIVEQPGEEVFAVFASAGGAVAAAVEIQHRHAERSMRVRIGLHTGEPSLTEDGYLGLDVHRAARICAAGHGGQILLSSETRELVLERSVTDLGHYLLKGISAPEHIYQLLEPGLSASFAPLRTLPAARQRQRLKLPRRNGDGQTALEQLAWATRARLPATPPAERPAVSHLANALSTAARSSNAARRFSAGVDRRRLQRRLEGYGSVRGRSTRAADAATAVERQLALLGTVEAQQGSLERAARRTTPRADEIERDTAALDRTLEEARAAIGTAGRPRRTFRRGVRKLGDEYVVFTFDETGIEHANAFATMSEARAFRRATKLAEKAQLSVRETPFYSDLGSAAGYGGGPG